MYRLIYSIVKKSVTFSSTVIDFLIQEGVIQVYSVLASLMHFGIRPFPESVRDRVKGTSGDPLWQGLEKALVWGQIDRGDACCTWAASYNFSCQNEKISAKVMCPPKKNQGTNKQVA